MSELTELFIKILIRVLVVVILVIPLPICLSIVSYNIGRRRGIGRENENQNKWKWKLYKNITLFFILLIVTFILLGYIAVSAFRFGQILEEISTTIQYLFYALVLGGIFYLLRFLQKIIIQGKYKGSQDKKTYGNITYWKKEDMV